MAIVNVTCPKNVNVVHYGGAQMLVQDDGQLTVPDYVAQALTSIDGFKSDNDVSKLQPADMMGKMAEADVYETNYLFYAYGRSLGATADRGERASELFKDRGHPIVSAQ